MDLRIFTEPQQGALYSDLLRVAVSAESLGYSAFFRSDHYLGMGTDGLPGPTDAWLSLAGLARETRDIRLGTLVTSATFRWPGPLAIQVAQVDEMSGGRVEFGLGAGWFAEEHAAYGLPFPDVAERFDRLEESLEVITGLWRTPVGEKYHNHGAHYPITDSPALPKPVQEGGPPIIIGGKGKKRTPALAARYAAEFNLSFPALAEVASGLERVRAACRTIDRDPASLTCSAALVVCCGRNDAEVARRAEAIGRDADELRTSGLAGTPAQVVDRIGQFAEAGVERLYLQVLDLSDLDHLALVAQQVKPQLD